MEESVMIERGVACLPPIIPRAEAKLLYEGATHREDVHFSLDWLKVKPYPKRTLEKAVKLLKT
jgi:hypothetical protein